MIETRSTAKAMSGIDLGAIADAVRDIVEQQEALGGDSTQLRLVPYHSCG